MNSTNIITSNPIEQIIEIYQSPEFWWVTEHTPKDNLRSYIWQLIERGNLFWAVENGIVVGICETWKIDFNTLGKMVCKIDMPIEKIDTMNGNIAFVVNVWIDMDKRNGRVFKTMRNEWYKRFHGCEYFVGHAQRKTVGMYKTFKVSELGSSLFKTGE